MNGGKQLPRQFEICPACNIRAKGLVGFKSKLDQPILIRDPYKEACDFFTQYGASPLLSFTVSSTPVLFLHAYFRNAGKLHRQVAKSVRPPFHLVLKRL